MRPARTADDPVHELHPPRHPAPPAPAGSFSVFDLGDAIQGAVAAMGITKPTPIQALAIPHVLAGRDVIAKAETGTGKTLAFGAPMMARIDPARVTVLGLVLCPTRELAQQVWQVLHTLGAARGVKVALIVGGEPIEPQVLALKAGSQVLVGTPGRILDLCERRYLSFPWAEYAIIDEADEMLEIGFIDDVETILRKMPEERQTLLFSATFPPAIMKLARDYTRRPAEVATAVGVSTVENITQVFMKVDDDDRLLALIRLVEQSDEKDVFLVFGDRRTEVDVLVRRLGRIPYVLKALHGGYDQPSRFRVMSAFRTGEVKVLVATDVASRGLDVAHVTHVINWGAPWDITDYTHRIGRTGRAGRAGTAITFVTPAGMHRWRRIEHAATWKIEEIPLPGFTRQRREAERERPVAPPTTPREAPRADSPRDERRPAPREEPRREEPRRAPPPLRDEPRREEPRRAPPPLRDEPRREEPRRAPPPLRDEPRHEAPRRDTPAPRHEAAATAETPPAGRQRVPERRAGPFRVPSRQAPPPERLPRQAPPAHDDDGRRPPARGRQDR